LQVIEIYSHQLLKYNWKDFPSKQRSFYFTKSSREPDPTTQRAGFGPRAVCLTPLLQMTSQRGIPKAVDEVLRKMLMQ